MGLYRKTMFYMKLSLFACTQNQTTFLKFEIKLEMIFHVNSKENIGFQMVDDSYAVSRSIFFLQFKNVQSNLSWSAF